MPLALPVHAQDHADGTPGLHANRKGAVPANDGTPGSLFGTRQQADTDGFRQAAARAYEDPQLGATRSIERWKRKTEAEPEKQETRRDWNFPGANVVRAAGKLLALAGEGILWIVVGLLLLVLAFTARWWLPWLRGSARRRVAPESPVSEQAVQLPETLPADVLASARQLWQQGKPRHALALLYRASVDELGKRADLALPPGSTEAQCLRASKRMPQEADRALFARMVRTWQYAAYAGRLPAEDDFDALLDALHRHYGWPA
jgi:hypothetical protein